MLSSDTFVQKQWYLNPLKIININLYKAPSVGRVKKNKFYKKIFCQ
ncbi:Uncharacterised protein [Chryseobacterium nakagawai]|nr:Uncharacterised protein [Chryseobacterium nakagawai]